MKKTIALWCLAALVSGARAERAWWDPRPAAPDLKAALERTVRERLGLPMTVEAVSAGWNEPVVFRGVTILDAKNRKRVTVREAELMSLAPPSFHLRDSEVFRPGWSDAVSLKVPAARASIAALAAGGQRTISVAAPGGHLTGPRPTPFTDGTAQIDSGRDGVSEIRFAGRALGGRASGSLTRADPGSDFPMVSIALSGISLAALTGKPRSEHFDASFTGIMPYTLKDLAGHGRVTIHGLSVDLTNEPQLVSLDRYARDGQNGTRLIGSFIRNEKLRGYADRMAAQVDYYRDVVGSLRRRHGLGSAGGPLSVYRGTATVSPFSGRSLSGRISVNLATKALSGYLSRVSVGRATLSDVRVTGSISAPRPIVNKNKVMLDGKPVPKVPSTKSQTMDAIVKSRPDKILRDIFGSGTGLFR